MLHPKVRLSFLTRQLGKLLSLLRIRYVATAAYPPVVNNNPQTFRPVEPPVEHVRNALAMLRTCALPLTATEVAFERLTVAAIVSRLWHAVELLEAADPSNLHAWNFGGYCERCGRNRFGPDGLRDSESCPASVSNRAAVELVHTRLTSSATTRIRRGEIEAHRAAEFQRALVRDA